MFRGVFKYFSSLHRGVSTETSEINITSPKTYKTHACRDVLNIYWRYKESNFDGGMVQLERFGTLLLRYGSIVALCSGFLFYSI